MALYRNTFRIESARLRYWDYADYGWYFITICVKNHACVLGEIVDGGIQLSPAGKIVMDELLRTVRKRPEAEFDVWCIMPNHVHVVLTVDNWKRQRKQPIPALNRPIVPYEEPEPALQLFAGSLGSIINRFKGNATKRIRNGVIPEFEWQGRFYDRVIRNEEELQSIREYILQNPGAWEEDDYHPRRHAIPSQNTEMERRDAPTRAKEQ